VNYGLSFQPEKRVEFEENEWDLRGERKKRSRRRTQITVKHCEVVGWGCGGVACITFCFPSSSSPSVAERTKSGKQQEKGGQAEVKMSAGSMHVENTKTVQPVSWCEALGPIEF
jgi:hypothetical protein